MNHEFERLVVWFIVLAVPFCLWLIKPVRRNVPPVVIEIFLSFCLGRAILGSFLPEVYTYLFPRDVLVFIVGAGFVAVMSFVYTTGLHINFSEFPPGQMKQLVTISLTSTIVPLSMGAPVAYVLVLWYPGLLGAQATTGIFVMAMAIAVSVTALPVLSAILTDMGETDTSLGRFVLAVAVFHDALLWVNLAILLALIGKAGGHGHSPMLTILYSLGYVGIVFVAVKPFLRRLVESMWWHELTDRMKLRFQGALFIACAAITEWIGIHYLTGAVLAGAIWPTHSRRYILKRVENFTLAILAPLFFVGAGLQADFRIGALEMWVTFAVMMVVAYMGQLCGVALILRHFFGLSWQESLEKTVMLTCKGIAELVTLSLIYSLGVISAEAYAGMVAMALVMTAATKPMTRLVRYLFAETQESTEPIHAGRPTHI